MRFLLIIILLFPTLTQAKDWVDAWFDNSVSHDTSAYEGQKRGFFTGGGFSGRINTTNDHLITATLPKISSGCGGIDLFNGGLSYLDKEYLVDKLQSMMQAAPAVAFDIALKTMSKEFSDTLGKFEATVDWLNSLQVNDCAISKRIVTTVSQGDMNVLDDIWSEVTSDVSLRDAINKNRQDFQETTKANRGTPHVDLKKEVKGCPKIFQNVFSGGSVVEKSAAKLGMKGYADIIRGLVGDVDISATKADKIPRAIRLSACPKNDPEALTDILHGKVFARKPLGKGGQCYESNMSSVVQLVRKRLNSIAYKLSNRKALTEQEILFINQSNVPVYSVLKKAILQQNVPQTIHLMEEIVATNYSAQIFDDLYRNTQFMLDKVRESFSQPASQKGECRYEVYAHAMDHFANLQTRVIGLRQAAKQSYERAMKARVTEFQYAQMHKEEYARLLSKKASDLQKHK